MLMMFCITLYQIFSQDLLPYVKLHKHIGLISIHILQKDIHLINIHILHKYTSISLSLIYTYYTSTSLSLIYTYYTSTFLSLIYTFAFIFNKWQNCMYNDTGIVLR